MSEPMPALTFLAYVISPIFFLVAIIAWLIRKNRATKIGTIRCKRCGQISEAAALGATFSDSYGCPYCRSTDWESLGNSQSEAHVSVSCPSARPENIDDLTKKCPACAETIKLEAKKCRFCGEIFDPVKVEKEVAAYREAHEKEHGAQAEKDRRAKQEAGLKDCPTCGKWDVFTAADGNGGTCEWCPHCNKPVEISWIKSSREEFFTGGQDGTSLEAEEAAEHPIAADEEPDEERPTFEITEDGCCPICPKCGYERQPKDEGFTRIECPKCMVVYAKALKALEQKQCGK